MHQPIKIGIPRTLYFYTYFPLWKTFFEELGLEVVFSTTTSKLIMDYGVRETVNDACIPIKVFHGHVMDLKHKVDYIFIPRLVCIDGKSTLCPKFLGLPDMVKSSIENLPTVVVDSINTKLRPLNFPGFFFRLGRRFTGNVWLIWRAYVKGLHSLREYRKQLLEGYYPQIKEGEDGQITMVRSRSNGKGALKLAVLAYPYVLYDGFMSVNLLKRLEAMGVDFFLPDGVQPEDIKKAKRHLPLDLFWHYSNQVAWAALHFLYEKKGQVDGIIHVTAFGCGPDAMVDKLIELESKNASMPFLTVTIDEHTGEAGMATRLEAFVDMLKNKKGRS